MSTFHHTAAVSVYSGCTFVEVQYGGFKVIC